MSYCGPSGDPTTASLCFIGEAPGKNELLQGQPFVGPSGRLLREALKFHAITDSNIYLTNVIKSYTPANPLISLPESDLELWKESLRAELSHVNSPILIPMGNTALWALSDNTVQVTYDPKLHKKKVTNGIENWRGSVIPSFNNRKLVPCFHPAHILYNPAEIDIFLHDLKVIIQQSRFPEIQNPQRTYYTYPTLNEALAYLTACQQAGKFAFDIETAQGICTCISFSYDPLHAMSIPLQGKKYWPTNDFYLILSALKNLLSNPDCTKIGQNVSYDIIGLRAMGIEVRPPIEDILLMHHSIDPLYPHSLAFQASIFTQHPFWKEWDIAPAASGGIEDLYSYNCKDSFITIELANYYQKTYPKKLNFYHAFHKPLQPKLIQMHEDGVCIDQNLSLKLADEFYSDGDRLNKIISSGLGTSSFNVNSPTAVMHVLYDVLQLPQQKKRQRRGPSKPTADDEALVNLYLQTQNPFILLIRDAKEKLKLASFLAPKSKNARHKRQSWDGRLRCEYSQNTQTGRLRSFAASTTGIGLNLQQIPSIVRRVFIPAPGYIFLEPDYQQAEARVIAWDGDDLDTMHFFELARQNPTKYDIHWRNCEIMMQQPRASLAPSDRQIAKPIGFGSWYGMSPQGIQKNILKQTDPPLFIPLNECARRLDLFRQNAPACFDRQERIKNEVLSTGKQISPTGFEWTYHEIILNSLKYCIGRRDHSELLRSAYAGIPQNVVSFLIGRSIVDLDNFLRLHGLGRVVLQVHDSLLLEILDSPDSLLQAFQAAKHIMESPFTIHNREMVIPIDCKLGYNWAGEAKGITTEDELLNAYERIRR